MKIVTAIIKPFKLEAVRAALSRIGQDRFTVTHIKGSGRPGGPPHIYRGREYAIRFTSGVKVELAVDAGDVDETVDAIIAAARTGEVGDGKIFIAPLEHAVRVRTGEIDVAAL
jgi:nitrogen regulatory protein P-II 2